MIEADSKAQNSGLRSVLRLFLTGCRGKGKDESMLLLLPQATHSIYITRTSNVKPAQTVERKNAD